MIENLEEILNSVSTKNAYESRELFILLINQIIDTDFESLLHLLYKIDVDEKKLKLSLNNAPGFDSAPIIADLMIERQLQKIKSREEFSNTNSSSDEEKW
ncbi:MAG: hypothetical protein ABI208_08275 [Ginsengibacter sp.]